MAKLTELVLRRRRVRFENGEVKSNESSEIKTLPEPVATNGIYGLE